MYDLLVIAGVLAVAWQGSRMGAVAAGLLAAELVASVTAGVLLHEALAGALIHGLKLAAEPFLPTDFPYQSLAVATSFILLTWGSFTALRFMLHADQPADEEALADRGIVEKVAGGLVGGCAGVLVCGALLLTLSMLPLPQALRPRPQNMFLDAGTMALRMAANFEPDRHEGVSLIVYGEPASTESNRTAKLTSEPSVQLEIRDEGQPPPEPLYADVDGNGVFTKDLYFLDLDGDAMRRVGLREKYVLGTWGGTLESYARDRPVAGGESGGAAAPKPAAAEPPPIVIDAAPAAPPPRPDAAAGPEKGKKPKPTGPAPEEEPPSDF